MLCTEYLYELRLILLYYSIALNDFEYNYINATNNEKVLIHLTALAKAERVEIRPQKDPIAVSLFTDMRCPETEYFSHYIIEYWKQGDSGSGRKL
jgi:hypothetical protein